MRWFEGNIAEAVSKSKAINAIFIVFVEGADEMTRELARALESPPVSSRLEDKEKFLSVKLSCTSENYVHFSQIYQIVPVPSVFFIGRDGAPLEVVCAGITPEKLSDRIDNILKQYYNNSGKVDLQDSSPGPSTSSASTLSASQAFLQEESQAQSKQLQAQSKPSQAAAQSNPEEEKIVQNKSPTADEGPTAAKQAKQDEEYEVVCDGDVCVRIPKTTGTEETVAGVSTEQMVTEAPPAEQPSLDARLDRAKEILEAKRREKVAKEKELEKQKELERRAMGQGVVELKRRQQEQELKEAAEARRKERVANELARQRVLEQIAQDRAERKARLQPPAPPVPATAASDAPPAPATPFAPGLVRIQLKLADGESRAVSFASENTLADVHNYIRDNQIVQSGSSFTLWTLFPRCELPACEDTLVARGLAPSAALLVLPGGAAPAVPRPVANLYALLMTFLTSVVLDPLSSAWSWFATVLSPRSSPAGSAPAPSGSAPPPAAPAPLRHRTNVHRLREDRSSDDETNTWNGNSTQQM